MKKGWWLFFWVFVFCCSGAMGQKIQYSRQTVVPAARTEKFELVTNVAGNHHLVSFAPDRFPEIHVFDGQLRLVNTKALPYGIKENCHIQLLAFQSFYYLYFHVPGATRHELWKIDADGDAVSVSGPFQQYVDTVLNGSSVACQLLKHNNQLVAITHAYFDNLKKVRSTVTRFDAQLAPQKISRVLFPYDAQINVLHQVALVANDLLVLKTGRDEEGGRTLEILKVDIDSSFYASNAFRAAAHYYASPFFQYNAADSTLLIYSMLTRPGQQYVFFSQLNAQLQETRPLTILKNQFRQNTIASFMWYNGKRPRWLSFTRSVARLTQVNRTTISPQNYSTPSFANPANRDGVYGRSWSPASGPQNTSVRFTLLNEACQVEKDSVVENKKSFDFIEPYSFAELPLHGKSCLLLVQNFSARHRGLLLMYVDAEGQLRNQDIPVMSKYTYHLSLAKAVEGDAVIVPYTHKKELGLVKIAYPAGESSLYRELKNRE